MMIEQRGRRWPLWEECSRKKGSKSVLGPCCRRNLSLTVQWWVNHGHIFSEQHAAAEARQGRAAPATSSPSWRAAAGISW
jgi:hypothetical protein